MKNMKSARRLALSQSEVSAARMLKPRLHEVGLLRFYLLFGDGNLRVGDWRAARRCLPEEAQIAVNLLLLQEEVPLVKCRKLLGGDVVDLLANLGILLLCRDRRTFKCAFRLFGFRDLWFFAQLKANPAVYFGDDSVALASYQFSPYPGRGLDLCAGPGIQSMIAAHSGRLVDAVEISAEAAKVQALNLAINNLERKVTTWNCSLEEFSERTTRHYGLITCNPPLLPTPTGIKYPFVGDGGEDGLNPLRTLVSMYASHLEPKGAEIQIIGTGLGSDRTFHFYNALVSVAQKHGLGLRVHALTRACIEKGADFFEGLVYTSMQISGESHQRTSDLYSKHFAKLGATFLYPFFAVYTNKSDKRQLTNTSNYAYGNWFV